MKKYIINTSMLGGAEVYTLKRVILEGNSEIYVNKKIYTAINQWLECSEVKLIPYSLSIYGIFKLKKRLKGAKEIVFANLAAGNIFWITSEKKILYIHEDPNALSKLTLIRIWILNRFFDEIRCPSKYGKNTIHKQIGIRANVDYFYPALERPIKKFEYKNKIKIAIIGRISKDKNTFYSAQLGALISNFYNVELKFIGDIIDQEVWHGIEDLIKNKKNIKYNQKFLSSREMLNEYKDIDVIIHSSYIENMPLILFEASDFKIPIFCYPAGGIKELLHENFLLTGDIDVDCKKIINWFDND